VVGSSWTEVGYKLRLLYVELSPRNNKGAGHRNKQVYHQKYYTRNFLMQQHLICKLQVLRLITASPLR
jgi:hypothetical protein